MIERALSPLVAARLSRYPAVALVGARQVGKTTLARALGGRYFDLEQPSDRTRLDVEWDRVTEGDTLLCLDEAQSWPDVFPRMRGAIDAARKRNGRFLLLGSVSPSLMTRVSESLAGRLSLLELTPFLHWETPTATVPDHWLRGGYPDGGVLDHTRFPQLRMTAAAHGQLRRKLMTPMIPPSGDRDFGGCSRAPYNRPVKPCAASAR